MKIVINEDFGGFSLSYEGMLRYALHKGVELYPEKGKYDHWTYWTVPNGQRPKEVSGAEWHAMGQEERISHNAGWRAAQMGERDMPRNDPALVQTVEELGRDAGGRFACLKIVDIPEGIDWEIEEYDGREWVAEKHRKWE